MKYIRTKDGKILNIDNLKYLDSCCYDYDENCKITKIYIVNSGLKYEYEVVKQANTIPELCDEFVVIAKDFPKYRNAIFPAYSHYNYVKTANTDKNVVKDTYGAIWVQLPNGAWRLEPVAKMNEKGELKLL